MKVLTLKPVKEKNSKSVLSLKRKSQDIESESDSEVIDDPTGSQVSKKSSEDRAASIVDSEEGNSSKSASENINSDHEECF